MVRLVAVLVVACLVMGCGTPLPDGSTGPATINAVTRDRDFLLVLRTSRSSWVAGEPIEVFAILRYAGGQRTEYWSSGGGPIAFGLQELGGSRHMDAIRDADCRRFEMTAADPLTMAYRKSGGFDPGDENEAFYRSFFDDPVFRLPAGRWEVTADVDLYLPPGCGEGREVKLSTSLTLRVE